MSVFFFPFESSTNNYLENMQTIVKSETKVEEFPSPKKIWKLFTLKERDVLVLNWVEDGVSQRQFFYVFLWCLHLLIARLIFKKIIWVRHNFEPHTHNNLKKYKFMCSLLNKISNLKITHRPVTSYDYLPHPTYSSNVTLISDEKRDIDYLYFGIIKRYKGLTNLLSTWPKAKKLFIRGLCEDKILNDEILSIVKKRNLNVDYTNVFLTNSELNVLLSKTKVVVLPHLENKMIVSGAFYHAASFGANVMLRDGVFFKHLAAKFSFVHHLNNFDVVLSKPSEVAKDLEIECGNKSILFHLKLLNVLK
jgi:beta-1,4-mannosyltransferase